MKLKNVTLTNFKSFKSEKVNFNNVNIVIGKNNAGKSNLIEGLDLFFNYRKKYLRSELNDCFLKNRGTRSTKIKFTILCVFEIKGKIIDIKVSKRVKKFSPINTEGELRVRFIHTRSGHAFKKYEIFNCATSKYIFLSNSEFSKLFKKVEFLYIPAFRDFSSTTILDDIFGRIFDKTSAVRKNRIISSLNDVRDNIDSNIIASFKRDFNSLIDNDFFGELNLDLQFKEKDRKLIQDILKTYTPLLSDSAQTEIIDKGSGLQSFIIIWLYNYFSTLSSKNLILAIEEPEAHLHPTAQKNLMKGIKNIFKSKKNQIIITTHSPFLANSTELDNIISIQFQKKTSKIMQVKNDYFTKDDLNYFERNLSAERKDIFFSDFIILTEGLSDRLVINYFLKLYGFNCNFENCSIIAVGGKGNFKYMTKLINAFKIPHILIFDRDFIYEIDDKKKEHFGFFNMCSYGGKKIPTKMEGDINLARGNILNLNKILYKLGSFSMTKDLEKDMMTKNTLPIFRSVLEDQSLTLDQISKEDKKANLIRRNIQSIAYDIPNKIKLPQVYQRLVKAIINKFKSI